MQQDARQQPSIDSNQQAMTTRSMLKVLCLSPLFHRPRRQEAEVLDKEASPVEALGQALGPGLQLPGSST